MLKNVARSAGKQLVKTGANIITDVIDGNTLKKSAISNLSHGGQQLISTLTSKLKTPKRGGVKRKSTNTSVKKKKRRLTDDIFT